MKAKVITNYNKESKTIMYGIAFQVKKGSQYCKYIMGMQSFKDLESAKFQLNFVQPKLDSLTPEQVEFIYSQPVNKHQYIQI